MPRSPIGRYVERDSFIHLLDARAKGVCLLLFLAASLSVHTVWSLGVVVAMFFLVVALSGLRLRVAVGSMKLLLLFLGMAMVLNFIFWQPESSGEMFVSPQPQLAGLLQGAWVGARLVLIVSFVNLFLLSTPPTECSESVMFFLSPVKRFVRGLAGVPFVAMIALRFVPLVVAEGNRIVTAQRSRGMRVERKLTSRVRELRPLVVPLFRSMLRRADELSVALEVRCFDPSQPRRTIFTRGFGVREVTALLSSACVVGLVRIIG